MAVIFKLVIADPQLPGVPLYQGMYPVVPPCHPPPHHRALSLRNAQLYLSISAWSHYIVNIILWETLVNIIFTNTVVIFLDFTFVKWVVKLSLTDCSILLKSSIGSYYVISVGVLLRRFTGQTGSCMTMIYSGKFLILIY